MPTVVIPIEFRKTDIAAPGAGTENRAPFSRSTDAQYPDRSVGAPMITRNSPQSLAVMVLATLALISGVFAHGYAQARPGPDPASISSVVICADGAMQAILIDQNGDPVEPAQCMRELCSACLNSLNFATGAHQQGSLQPSIWHRAAFSMPSGQLQFVHPLADPRPRGPPTSS